MPFLGSHRGLLASQHLTSAHHVESNTKREPGETVLHVENLTRGTVVKNVSFSARAGEILGVAALVGSGRSETICVMGSL